MCRSLRNAASAKSPVFEGFLSWNLSGIYLDKVLAMNSILYRVGDDMFNRFYYYAYFYPGEGNASGMLGS